MLASPATKSNISSAAQHQHHPLPPSHPSTHAYQSHPACQARIRTKCDDTLPPTSDCVCFMARPWPHLFESWQTYYQHTPAKNDVFVQGWNAFIIYILIEFAIQISHSRVFYLVFLCKWADFERRVACQPQHFWDRALQNYYVLCTYVPYLLRENIS